MTNYGDNNIVCPLLNKTIMEANCYDINMIRRKLIKVETLLPGIKIDREKSAEICPKCKHCPF